jgi:hypothetical protein
MDIAITVRVGCIVMSSPVLMRNVSVPITMSCIAMSYVRMSGVRMDGVIGMGHIGMGRIRVPPGFFVGLVDIVYPSSLKP